MVDKETIVRQFEKKVSIETFKEKRLNDLS